TLPLVLTKVRSSGPRHCFIHRIGYSLDAKHLLECKTRLALQLDPEALLQIAECAPKPFRTKKKVKLAQIVDAVFRLRIPVRAIEDCEPYTRAGCTVSVEA